MSVVLDSKWVELETSSSFELNALLHDSTNIFLGMKDSHTRSAYNTFTINNQTMSSLFFLNVFISLFSATLLQILITDFSPHYNYNGYVHWIICTIYLVIINIAGWSAYVYHRWSFSGNNGSIPFQSRRTLQRIQMALYFAINFFVCYRHITRSVNGQCPIDQNVNNNWNCNPVGLSKGISGETSIIIMIIPIMYSISVRGAHFEFAMFLWFMTVGTLLFSIIYPGATNGILFVTYYCIGSLAALVEARRNNLFLFFTHQKLQEFLQAKEKAADAANAEEMRHMIGNVAHDLKTPLSSFVSGIEFISQSVSELSEKIREVSSKISAETEECCHGIRDCITNMRNTNAFMLMTINRSIDYTKASKGLKLVPRQETINLLEALALPLMCMKDIQTRIPVTLEPLDKRICSFIITDKQWLQENLLCLLSNAVKYSNDGSVAVRALCVSVQTHRAMIDERNSTAAYTTGTQSHIVHMMNHVNLQEEQEQEEKRAGSSNEPSSYLRIEVEDHGIGLSNEAMVTLFSPFKQAQRLAGGTGLGLFSLAKRIEALEGLCGVQHRRDGEEGSLFWFQIPYRPDPVMSRSEGPNTFGSSSQPSQRPLPLLQASSFTWVPGSSTPAAGRHMADNTVPTTHITSSEAGAHGDLLKPPTSPPTLPSDAVVATNNAIAPAYTLIGAGLEVLVVDDAPAIVKMTTMMLRKHKHNVATATNGAEAVKLVCDRVRKLKKSFDVVLMDLQMPVMDGLEATRRLRSMEAAGYWASVVQVEEENSDVESVQQRGRVEGIHALIIGVSANSDSETMQEAYRAGVDDFIAKPFTMDTFYRVFQRSQSVLPTAEGMAESRCISRGDVALSMVSHD